MTIYQGVNGVNRQVKSIYEGVSGVNREVKERWEGVGGGNRKVFETGDYLIKQGIYLSTNQLSSGMESTHKSITTITQNAGFIATLCNAGNRNGVFFSQRIDLSKFTKLNLKISASHKLNTGSRLWLGISNLDPAAYLGNTISEILLMESNIVSIDNAEISMDISNINTTSYIELYYNSAEMRECKMSIFDVCLK